MLVRFSTLPTSCSIASMYFSNLQSALLRTLNGGSYTTNISRLLDRVCTWLARQNAYAQSLDVTCCALHVCTRYTCVVADTDGVSSPDWTMFVLCLFVT